MNKDKFPIDPSWFSSLGKARKRQGGKALLPFQWLIPLKSEVEYIANFGCWGGEEPFELLWTLDASEVVIVEKKGQNLKNFEDVLRKVEGLVPTSLEGRSFQPITADMTTQISSLSGNHFDLAFCKNVLYSIGEDPQAVQNAINEMVRITKEGGFVIAVEPKFRREFEGKEGMLGKISIPKKGSEPEDMSRFFKSAGLSKISLDNAPAHSYCYKKG